MNLKYRIKQLHRKIRKIGLRQFIQYSLPAKGSLAISIENRKIWMRRGTPDLITALSSFDGEFSILRYVYPANYTGVIVDAGGYIGTAAIALSEMYPKATVITIEPSKENFALLQKNIDPYPNIKPIQGALTEPGKSILTLRNRNTGAWGFTVVDKPLDCPEASELHQVPALQISSLGVALEDIGILKLDIEGAECALFTKDNDALSKIPFIIVELHDWIVAGCQDAFTAFSQDRIVIKERGEKYLSIKKNYRTPT